MNTVEKTEPVTGAVTVWWRKKSGFEPGRHQVSFQVHKPCFILAKRHSTAWKGRDSTDKHSSGCGKAARPADGLVMPARYRQGQLKNAKMANIMGQPVYLLCDRMQSKGRAVFAYTETYIKRGSNTALIGKTDTAPK